MKIVTLFAFAVLICTTANSWQDALHEKIKQGNPPIWMMRQIKNDLKAFKTHGISMSMLSSAKGAHLTRFTIKNGKITSKNFNNSPSFFQMERVPSFIFHLNRLQEVVKLPDVAFVADLADVVEPANRKGKNNTPLFAYAKNKSDVYTILVPEIFAAIMPNFDEKMQQVVAAGYLFPWHAKKEMAIWRGTTTDKVYTMSNLKTHPRFNVVELSKKHPELLDCRFSGINPALVRDHRVAQYLITNGYIGGWVRVEDHLKYKYQILLDGYSTSWPRAYWQLVSNSVVFKHDSNDISWYYDALKPYMHYIPCAHDCSDLREKIAWAQKNDDKARKIAESASQFCRDNLTYADMLYYVYLLLHEYAKLLEFNA